MITIAAQIVSPLLLLFGLGLLGVYLSFATVQGRQLPERQLVDIDWLLPEGDYLVDHGDHRLSSTGASQYAMKGFGCL